MRAVLAEFIGTFALVFAGTGAMIVNDLQGGVIGHVGVCLCFGLVIMIMVFTFGETSGAHFNPAVSLVMVLRGELSKRAFLAYVAAQCVAAVAASSLLAFLFPGHPTLGATLSADPLRGLIAEVVTTSFLLMVILRVTGAPPRERGFAPPAIGAAVCLAALFMGPVSGASMNPARSLGPALVAGVFRDFWIYIVGPTLGALCAAFIWRFLEGRSGSREVDARS